MTDFARLLEAQIARIDATSDVARQALYVRLRDALKNVHARGGAARTLAEDELELQLAIDAVEARFRPAAAAPDAQRKSFGRRVIGHAQAGFKKAESVLAVAKRVAAVVAVALPIGGFLYWFLVSSEPELPQVHRAAIEASACSVLSKDSCDGIIAAIERTKSAAAITAANAGDLKPAGEASSERAKRLAGDPKATEGEKAQARFDAALLSSSLRAIVDNTGRTAEATERIEKNTAALKRETSSDPRKELVNRGRSWDDFQSTFVSCHLDDLKLFKEAGARLPKEDFIFLLAHTRSPDCLELYRDQFVAAGAEACFSDAYFRPRAEDTQIFIGQRGTRQEMLRDITKVAGRLAFAESICGQDRMRREYPSLYASSQRRPQARP